jgi:hypothetical protein
MASHTLGDCTYCGMPADTVDHLIPICYSRPRRPSHAAGNCGPTVPCCRECNMLLGTVPLFTVAERASELSDRLENRYRKILGAPVWTEEDLVALGPSLEASIRAKQFLRLELLERLRNTQAVAHGVLERAIPLHEIDWMLDSPSSTAYYSLVDSFNS